MSRWYGSRAAALVATLFLCGCSASPPPPSPAAPPSAATPVAGVHVVSGTVPLAPNNGIVIVTLTPQSEGALPAPEREAQMDQVNLTFVPALLFVQTGQPVTFLNNDDVLHNVRVREEATREGAFNVAIPTGERYIHTFPRDGFYIVGCDIHPGMSAAVFAASTPYVTTADAEGRFSFPDVEAGAFTLTAFVGEKRLTQSIEVVGPNTDVAVSE